MLSIPQDRVKNNGEMKIQTLFIMEIDSGRQDGCRPIRGWSPLQLALQLRPPVFIARLAKQGEHILLVGLHPRLIERVHVQQIAGEAAGVLEKVDQLPQVCRSSCFAAPVAPECRRGSFP